MTTWKEDPRIAEARTQIKHLYDEYEYIEEEEEYEGNPYETTEEDPLPIEVAFTERTPFGTLASIFDQGDIVHVGLSLAGPFQFIKKRGRQIAEGRARKQLARHYGLTPPKKDTETNWQSRTVSINEYYAFRESLASGDFDVKELVIHFFENANLEALVDPHAAPVIEFSRS